MASVGATTAAPRMIGAEISAYNGHGSGRSSGMPARRAPVAYVLHLCYGSRGPVEGGPCRNTVGTRRSPSRRAKPTGQGANSLERPTERLDHASPEESRPQTQASAPHAGGAVSAAAGPPPNEGSGRPAA